VMRQVRVRPALLDRLHLVGALRRVGQHVPHAPWAVGAMVQATRVCVYLAHTPEAGPRSALCAEPIIGMLGARVQELVLHVPPGRSRRETTLKREQLAQYARRVRRVMEQVMLSHARQESIVKPRATRAPFVVRIKFLVAPVGPAAVPVARSVLLPRGGPR